MIVLSRKLRFPAYRCAIVLRRKQNRDANSHLTNQGKLIYIPFSEENYHIGLKSRAWVKLRKIIRQAAVRGSGARNILAVARRGPRAPKGAPERGRSGRSQEPGTLGRI
jgi:hypothetical protein